MPSDTLILVPYFDFFGSRARAIALAACLKSLPDHADVVVICHGRPPMVRHRGPGARHVIDIPRAGILFQKERLWNLGLGFLRPSHTLVAWLDADVVFQGNAWLPAVHAALRTHNLVHLFRRVEDVTIVDERLSPTGRQRESVVARLGRDIAPEHYFSVSGVSLGLGVASGFGWAARPALVGDIGFPDWFILGSGDKALLAAAYGQAEAYAQALGLNDHMRRDYVTWAHELQARVAGRVGLVDQTIAHVAHGDYANRLYGTRYSLLADPAFRVQDALRINPCGAWEWTEPSGPLATRVHAYFVARGD